MLWICLACCWTPATSFASSSVWSDQPHSHSTRFCIPHLLNGRPRRGKGGGFNPKTQVFNIIAGQLWRMFGGILLRVYLTGEVAVERGERLLRDADLGGRQGRLALVYLAAEREGAVTPAGLAGRVEALVWNGELALAKDQARAAVELEPFRESGYRRLMQVLVKRGDRAEAVRVYNDCKRRLAEELGVAPSDETESLMRTVAG